MRKKEKQRNILIGIVLLALAMLVITQINQNTLSLTSDGVNVEIAQNTQNYNKPLIITPQGSSIPKGSSQVFTIENGIDASCFPLINKYYLKKGTSIEDSGSLNLGNLNTGTSQSLLTVTIASDSPEGTYSLEIQYECSGQLLKDCGTNLFCEGSPAGKDSVTFTVPSTSGGTQCNQGETRCVQQMYQTCGNNGIWDNHGLTEGQCGYNPSGDTKLPNGATCQTDSQCVSNICAYFQCTQPNSQCDSSIPEEKCDGTTLYQCNEKGFWANQGESDRCHSGGIIPDGDTNSNNYILYVGVGLVIIGAFLYLRQNKRRRK